jgi:hypothetical protein
LGSVERGEELACPVGGRLVALGLEDRERLIRGLSRLVPLPAREECLGKQEPVAAQLFVEV